MQKIADVFAASKKRGAAEEVDGESKKQKQAEQAARVVIIEQHNFDPGNGVVMFACNRPLDHSKNDENQFFKIRKIEYSSGEAKNRDTSSLSKKLSQEQLNQYISQTLSGPRRK